MCAGCVGYILQEIIYICVCVCAHMCMGVCASAAVCVLLNVEMYSCYLLNNAEIFAPKICNYSMKCPLLIAALPVLGCKLLCLCSSK